MEEIIFKDVSKQYEGNHTYALKDFNLTLQAGELIVIVGPSGSGKSTLLELICGFEPLTKGDIRIGSTSIIDKLPKDRDVSMVFQNYALLPHLTVYENIAFGMKIRKESKAYMKEKVEWAAKLLELTPYLQVKPKKLSGGQRQRVALARAMVREPKLFLMDEPLSNLDAKLRDTMVHEIQELQKTLGISMMYVTHDQVEAMTIADRMVILNSGEIQQVGTPFEIYHQPANLFVARFIGRPTINLFTCKYTKLGILIEEELLIPVQEENLKEEESYTLGIRSEHVKCVLEDEHLQAPIQKVEYLGSETLLYFNYKKCSFVAKDYSNRLFKVGDLVKIRFDLQYAHYFEPQTTNNIRRH